MFVCLCGGGLFIYYVNSCSFLADFSIKSFSSKKIEKNKHPSTFIIDGESINDPAIISNKFNNYFVEIGPKLNKDLNASINPLSYLDINNNSIFFPEITENDTLRTVTKVSHRWMGSDTNISS